MAIQIKLLPAFYDLVAKSASEKSYDSGRGCAKSVEFADATIIKSLQGSRILCGREIQKSIKESVKKLIEERIDYYNLWPYFERLDTEIRNRMTGKEYIFTGLHRNIDSIKSMHGIDLLWIEEAQSVSEESLVVLLPTILRRKDAEIWYSWNPTNETDAVYKRFYSKNLPPNSIVKHLTIDDNPFFPNELRVQMEFDYKHNPELAAHVWGGQLRPSDVHMAVLPYQWLQKAVDAHVHLGITFENKRFKYGGFDIADTGEDHNAFAIRNGSVIEYVEEWDNNFIYQAVEHVDFIAKRENVLRIYFDAVGVGSGAKGDFDKLTRDYYVHAFVGGSSPEGADEEYLQESGTVTITNGRYFRNLKAQAWWNVRQRLENTMRLLDGEKVSIDRCLFLSNRIHKLDELLREMAQPIYLQDDSKLMVDKKPNDATSPNKGDAVILSFAHDFFGIGLKGY